ncbi:PB1 domain protein [Rhizoctonia solani AG-3 Rhs1AP]|uniref:PB1 domain protein n=1 Tax=Rhizoctonia solani AG-3 Rhs1AP TaxID=1086054 RepID=X8JJ38_9AGAM|nr:PB1 domain protein [Rhizoctonia solani AG-3 Rhs1AP]
MVQFKLQHRGLVRKVTFKNVEQPSWHELSWKIGDMCSIPHAAVALTYLDPDGDKITISSQAELREYYSSYEEEHDDDPSAPHKFIVRNLDEGIPDDGARDPREDMFLLRDGQTMAASTVGGGSQWGINPEDEAERDPTKLRLSGYSTFADALSPLARSAGGTDFEYSSSSPDKEDLPGGFKPSPSPQPEANKNNGGGSSWFGAWGKVLVGATEPSPAPPPPPPIPPPAPPSEPTKPIQTNSNSRLDPNSNPWAEGNVTKTPAWAASTTPTSTSKAPSLPWAPPSHVATGTLKGPSRGQVPQQQAQSKLVPPPVAATVQMDSMVADRATAYEGSPAVLATVPRSRKHKKKLEKAAKEEEARRAAEAAANPTGSRFEELELKAMEREAAREREDNARVSAEAAARAAVDDHRRYEQHEWDRQHEPLDKIKVDEKPPRDGHQTHQRGVSDISHSSEWEHVQEQAPEQEDEQAYMDRIAAARANVFGTSPSNAPTIRQRKSSTKDKDKSKSSRPNSKVYPPTPAPKKYYDSDLLSENGQNGAGGSAPPTPGAPAPPSTAQVCNDVADLLVSFGRILDSERDLLDAIRETFSSGPHPGALSDTFGDRNLSPEMFRIVASVDDLLTKILPSRPAPSPYSHTNMELEPRVPTPSVTPTPVVPADPEFNIPKSEFATSFEFANRGRQQGAPIINVPRPKYPASSLTRDGYATGTTPPSQTSYGFATSPYPTTTSPDKSSRTRSRSRPPPNDFEIVPPSYLPPQARVVPPPVVPGEETDDSPMTPEASRGFTRQSAHEGGLVLASQSQSQSQSQRSVDPTKADMEAARQHYKSQRELYKLERAERKKEMEERAAAKAERKRAKAMASSDPKITDLTNQLQNLVPPRPFEAERRYVESPYENPRTAGPYPGSQASTVYAEGLGQVTLVPPMGFAGSNAAVTAPVSPVHDEPSTQSFERARRRRQSLTGGASPERYSHSRQPAPNASHDAYPGASHHAAPYPPAQPPQDLAKRVALRLTEMGYTPQKYPTLPSIVGHRIRPLMNTPGVNEDELAYHIVRDLYKYSGRGQS